MRTQIIDSVFEHMSIDKDVFFLTADMGINLVEKFAETFPDRFLNVGIAEQNLIGISAGLCNLGYKPFVYTISNFLIHRCFEQIRNDIILHNYPITLIGTSTGYDNSPLGPTHHIIDDWGVLKTIPNIDIYCPSSVSYASTIIPLVLDQSRPSYIRVPKGEFSSPSSCEHLVFLPGQSQRLLLISYGSLSQNCIEAQKANTNLSVLIFNRLRPIDRNNLFSILSCFSHLFVIEDHFAENGLYGQICQFSNETKLKCEITSMAPTDYIFTVGTSTDYFYQLLGIDKDGILLNTRD